MKNLSLISRPLVRALKKAAQETPRLSMMDDCGCSGIMDKWKVVLADIFGDADSNAWLLDTLNNLVDNYEERNGSGFEIVLVSIFDYESLDGDELEFRDTRSEADSVEALEGMLLDAVDWYVERQQKQTEKIQAIFEEDLDEYCEEYAMSKMSQFLKEVDGKKPATA